MEERLAYGRSQLERYRSLAAAWQKRLQRSEMNQATDDEFIQGILQQLEAIITTTQLQEFQSRVEREIRWLEQDFDRRVNERAEQVRKKQRSVRRLVGAASTVLAAAAKQPGKVSGEVLSVLKQAQDGAETDRATINRAVSAAFRSLSQVEEKTVSAVHRELAARLGAGQERRTINDWIEETAPPDQDSGDRMDQMLSEMSLRFGVEAARPFLERAAELAREGDPHRRKLLIDSLTIEMARFTRSTAAHQRLIEIGESVLASLQSQPGSSRVTEELQTALKNETGQALGDAIERARQDHEQHIAAEGLKHRRKALLEALNSLGYEVQEGMETALLQEGRVVIEHSAREGYGVELAGLVANDRFQVRAMRFDDTTGAPADELAHEVEWCSTFSDLRAILGQAGDELVIEQAIGVGKRPLKVIPRRDSRRRGGDQMRQKRFD
jgi:hypothetical protein